MVDEWRDEVSEECGINFDRYEVSTIINDNLYTYITTNSLEEATMEYEEAIAKFSPFNNINHVIVTLYDYDKNANINYYDSETDVC